MKVLFYNWVDYLDDEKRGGGVSIYQRNLMDALSSEDAVEAVFLSSGISYDLTRRAVRWAQVNHGPEQDRERRFEIINSGTLAPSHHSFGDDRQVAHAPTRNAFFDFIDATGPYDVVHFNNLEGLPAEVLSLKERWPQTRVILSLHNYYPVCPQVNLWQRETVSCTDFEAGHNCVGCLLKQHDGRMLRLANGLAFRLKTAGIRPGTRTFELLFRQSMRVGRRLARLGGALRRQGQRRAGSAAVHARTEKKAASFVHRRAEMVRLINQYCDRVLSVSDRVGEIAKAYGIDPDLVATSYIGTREARKFAETRARETFLHEDGTVTLAYLGYMRSDKGFFFLLEALEAMPPDMLARLRLLVAARRGDPATMVRLEAIGAQMAGLHYEDGYSHDDLDRLLATADVGLVPVLWEDNLPQVAIEMHARHIPLLTSSMGGARELGHCDAMVFPAGSKPGFQERIAAILEGRVTPAAYWQNAVAPVAMHAHVKELLGHFAVPAASREA